MQDKESTVAHKLANACRERGFSLKKIEKLFRRTGRGNNVSWRGVWPNPYADREEQTMEAKGDTMS